MGLKEIEFVSTQDLTIKLEDGHESQLGNQSWIFSSVDHASDKKCGEIFILGYNQLRFVCAFCNRSFDKICDFGDHLRQHEIKHLQDIDSSTHNANDDTKFLVEDTPGPESYDDTNVNTSTIEEIPDSVEDSVSFGTIIDLDIQSWPDPGDTEGVEIRSTINVHVCKLCKKEYINAKNLRRHNCRGSATLINQQVGSDNVCIVCKKKYANKKNLKRHNCRGIASNIESTRKKTNNINWNEATDFLVDTEVKDNANLHSGNETSCSNGFLSEELENGGSSVLDHDSKDADKCEEANELRSKKNGGELFNVLVQDGIELLECKVCTRLFESAGRLNRHKCTQISKKYKCNICGNRFLLRESLKKHRCPDQITKSNTITPDRKIKDVNKKEELGKRNSIDQEITNPDLYCDICKKQLKFEHSFRKHGMLHSKPPSAMKNKPDYLKCQYCGVKVMKHSDWLPHERTHSSQFRHVCPYCSKVFKWGISLKSHIKCHTGERPYKCDQCPAIFAHNTNLAIHKRRIHLKHHPHACSYCPVKCVTRSELRQHIKRHTGDKAYQCEVCGKSFLTAAKLSEHIAIHSNIKNVQCPLCPKAFIHKKRLAHHMTTHSNEKRHTCDVCGAKFSRARSLVNHKKLHLPEKGYVCPICGKAFAQATGLYSHKKWHHEVVL